MSLINVLRTGVSGMNAQANRISTVAENIQNAGTTGYKRSSAEFSSLLIDSTGNGNYNSGAVETTVRRSQSEEGPVAFTTSKTDLAIQGNGFFVVKDENGSSFLTRAGNFVVDGPTGNLVNAGGFTLMGFDLAGGEPNPALNSTVGMVPVNVTGLGLKAVPSTEGTTSGNLPSDSPALTGALSTTNFTKKTSLVTYDKLGKSVTLDIYLGKTATANEWTAAIYAPGGTTPLDSVTLAFDGSGKLTGTAATDASASFTIPGGESFTLDMSATTQLAGNYALQGAADGRAPAAVKGTEFASDGTVYATYDDGTRLAAFKVPLADVRSPDNLDPRSGNVFSTNSESGSVELSFPTQNGRGSIKSGALEQSNVDVSAELTTMIESQSVYTANSKVFMTGNELLDTLMNLKR